MKKQEVELEKIYREWRNEKMAETAVKNLQRNCFVAEYVKDAQAAVERIMGMIPKDACVGWGDSLTLKELGIIEKLESGGYHRF